MLSRFVEDAAALASVALFLTMIGVWSGLASGF
jgi:hypothetical protein